MTNETPIVYQPNILIVGYSGSGKSTSYEGLPQDETTAIIETELKALPFKNKFPKIKTIESFEAFNKAFDIFKADPVVKIIVIDSISKHLERCLHYCRCGFKNYDIWTNYGGMGTALMNSMHSRDKIIIAISLDELVEEESNETGVVAKTYRKMAATFMGKELQGKIDKEFTIVCHTVLKKDQATGLMNFRFRVKPDGLTTAKTPRSMFSDAKDGLISNDMALIIKEISKISS